MRGNIIIIIIIIIISITNFHKSYNILRIYLSMCNFFVMTFLELKSQNVIRKLHRNASHFRGIIVQGQQARKPTTKGTLLAPQVLVFLSLSPGELREACEVDNSAKGELSEHLSSLTVKFRLSSTVLSYPMPLICNHFETGIPGWHSLSLSLSFVCSQASNLHTIAPVFH